jgi:hypothetical protein
VKSESPDPGTQRRDGQVQAVSFQVDWWAPVAGERFVDGYRADTSVQDRQGQRQKNLGRGNILERKFHIARFQGVRETHCHHYSRLKTR